ncbi:MAG: hypothetical protein ACK44G_10110, partial [Aphanizomenon sp.]
LETRLKRYLALTAITEDQDLKKNLSLSSKTDLQNKLKQAEKDIVDGLIVAYRHLAWCGQNTIDYIGYNDFSTATKAEGNSWLERVENHLKHQRSINAKIAANVLLNKGLSVNETEKSLQDIYNNFLRTPGHKPLLENESVILEAVKTGVKEGKLGIRFNGQLYYQDDDDNLNEITLAAIVVRPEVAQAEKAQLQTQFDNNSNNNNNNNPDFHSNETKENTSQTSSGKPTIENPLVNTSKVETTSGTYNINPSSETKTKVKKVKFKADLPWSKLSNLVRGVITPLQAGAANIKITIEIEAESSQGYDRHTLDNTVKETLKQLDSKILNWEEDEK